MQIHIARKGVTLGTFDLDELKAKAALAEIELTDHAYLDTIGSWKLISEVPELHEALFPQAEDSESIPPPPPPIPDPSDSIGDTKETAIPATKSGIDFPLEEWKRFLSNKVVQFGLVGLVGLALLVVGYSFLGSGHHLDVNVLTVGQNVEWNQKLNGAIHNARASVDRGDGKVTITFDYDTQMDVEYRGIPRQFLVRFFDKSGNYLTRFTTEERFVEIAADFPYNVHRLKPSGNKLEYIINTRDAAFAESVEFGFNN